MDWLIAIALLLSVLLLPVGLVQALGSLARRMSPSVSERRLPSISRKASWQVQLLGVAALLTVLGVRALLGRQPDWLMLFYGSFLYVATIGALFYWRYPELFPFVSASSDASPLQRRLALGAAYVFATMATVAAIGLAVLVVTVQV